MAFHEVQFPTNISYGVVGGPERRTYIKESTSGYEHRNQVWQNSRRVYNAGYGIKSIDDLYTVSEFFEERRGQFHGFRFKDWLDFKSCGFTETPAFDDQLIGTGDGTTRTFQLKKIYGSAYDPWTREIKKPVSGSVVIGVNGSAVGSGWTVDTTTGIVTFTTAPTNTHPVTAGFEFDVPVRFNFDLLQSSIVAYNNGEIPDIQIIEIRV